MNICTFETTQLSNGLRVLLITEPGMNLSAASLDVGEGSYQDPDEI